MIFQRDIKELNKLERSGGREFGNSGFLHACILPIVEFQTYAKKLFCILFLGIFFLNLSFGQVRKELEDRRRQLLKDIELTSNLLNKTTKNKAAALDRFIALQKQISKREQLIETLQEEIQFTNLSIDRATEVVGALSDDVERLQKEYGELVRQAYRQRKNNSKLAFLFSAESFNQAFRRWQYLKQYDQYRKKQTYLILETQKTLSNKKQQLEKYRLDKEKLLSSEEKQTALLAAELGNKSQLLRTLKRDESRLKKDLRKQRDDHERLNQAIEKAIRNEIIARRKRERNKEPLNTKPNTENSSAALDRLSGNFKSNRGRLPMPVQSGVITKRFGKQPHPTLRGIEITNNGIDIRTNRNADVVAIFEGKIISKQFIPGHQNMLIIQHGNYYTVYSNLEEVFVKKGTQVKTREVIGKVGVDRASNVSKVHFEIWRDKVRLDPEDWVR